MGKNRFKSLRYNNCLCKCNYLALVLPSSFLKTSFSFFKAMNFVSPLFISARRFCNSSLLTDTTVGTTLMLDRAPNCAILDLSSEFSCTLSINCWLTDSEVFFSFSIWSLSWRNLFLKSWLWFRSRFNSSSSFRIWIISGVSTKCLPPSLLFLSVKATDAALIIALLSLLCFDLADAEADSCFDSAALTGSSMTLFGFGLLESFAFEEDFSELGGRLLEAAFTAFDALMLPVAVNVFPSANNRDIKIGIKITQCSTVSAIIEWTTGMLLDFFIEFLFKKANSLIFTELIFAIYYSASTEIF